MVSTSAIPSRVENSLLQVPPRYHIQSTYIHRGWPNLSISRTANSAHTWICFIYAQMTSKLYSRTYMYVCMDNGMYVCMYVCTCIVFIDNVCMYGGLPAAASIDFLCYSRQPVLSNRWYYPLQDHTYIHTYINLDLEIFCGVTAHHQYTNHTYVSASMYRCYTAQVLYSTKWS